MVLENNPFMATIHKFEDLEIWQLARIQAQDIFGITQRLPFNKDFELRNQINASAGSVMDNIAEGFERSGNNEFRHFLFIAKGSNGEVRSQLYRALDRNYISAEQFKDLYDKNCAAGNRIMSLIMYLQRSEIKGQRYKTK